MPAAGANRSASCSQINTDLDELYPSLDADGNLYFASGPPAPGPDARWDIHRARYDGKSVGVRERLDVVNATTGFDSENPVANWDFNPEISADGRMLIFTSLRGGGHGFGDLYVSHLTADGWTEPRNLGPVVNTAHDEFHPTLSPDGRTLYFARTILSPELVPGSFFRVPVDAIPALRRP